MIPGFCLRLLIQLAHKQVLPVGPQEFRMLGADDRSCSPCFRRSTCSRWSWYIVGGSFKETHSPFGRSDCQLDGHWTLLTEQISLTIAVSNTHPLSTAWTVHVIPSTNLLQSFYSQTLHFIIDVGNIRFKSEELLSWSLLPKVDYCQGGKAHRTKLLKQL